MESKTIQGLESQIKDLNQKISQVLRIFTQDSLHIYDMYKFV